jgi:hypothetical protein
LTGSREESYEITLEAASRISYEIR